MRDWQTMNQQAKPLGRHQAQTDNWGSAIEKADSWETSYTKQVVSRLMAVSCSPSHINRLCDAARLLEGYHRDLRIPYAQRDEAQARVKDLESVVSDLQRRLCRIEDIASMG